MRLDTLAGNAGLKRQLSAQAAGRGLSHAYLISGPAGSGKTTLAGLLAAALVCTSAGETPCGTCAACKKALRGIHPDIIHVDLLEDKREILVEQARKMRTDAFIRPNEAERKVYIVHHADTMNTFAQNAILKLLEEGPAYAAFLLLAENPGSLLATIRSRCESLALTPLTTGEVRAYLTGKFPDADPALIAAAADRCGGILGLAVAELEGSAANEELPAAADKLLTLAAAGDELALAAHCVSLEKWKREDLAALLEREVGLLRDALALQAGVAVTAGEAVREAGKLPRKRLETWVERLERLGSVARARFNVGVGHLCGAVCVALSE